MIKAKIDLNLLDNYKFAYEEKLFIDNYKEKKKIFNDKFKEITNLDWKTWVQSDECYAQDHVVIGWIYFDKENKFLVISKNSTLSIYIKNK